MAELVIVTGPPGSGKSTVAPLVADGFESSVLIQGDWFFGRWRRGAIDPWLPEARPQTAIAAAAAAAAAGTFSRADCADDRTGDRVVVYDGFIPPLDLPGFAAAAGLHHAPHPALHYAVLLPSEATCAARVASRTGHGFTSEEATRRMYRDFAGNPLAARHRITNIESDPPEVAAQVRSRIRAGDLLWTAPRGPA